MTPAYAYRFFWPSYPIRSRFRGRIRVAEGLEAGFPVVIVTPLRAEADGVYNIVIIDVARR